PDKEGRPHITSTFYDPDGKPALIMDARMRGDYPVQVRIQQLQSKESGRIELSPGRVDFEVTTPTGAKETSQDDALGIIFVGPALTDWMVTDGPWRRLVAGETVDFKVAAWRRMSTYSFELERHESSDDKTLVLTMAPSNIIYQAFAKEMLYAFDLKTRRMLRYSGLTALKMPDEDGDLEDVVAEIVFRR
ncbi:unnamed protein product, partial [Laminaria digitata]